MVLVDSASTDQTRQIAARRGVQVLALPPSWPISAAAGRFTGMRCTQSEAVLFVDGDYVMEPSWLALGLRILVEQNVAGVCGTDREALEGRNAISRYVLERTAANVPRSEIEDVAAIAVGVYWRQWVDKAGGFQPFLKGAEDRDLALRVRNLGGRLLKTRAVMGTHYWSPGEELTLVEYFRSVARWSYGEGQAARYAVDEPGIRRSYFRRYFHLRHLIQIEEALAVATWGATLSAGILLRSPALALVAAAAAGIAVTYIAIRTRGNFRQMGFALHAIPYVVIRLSAFGFGFLDRPKPARCYPRGPPPEEA